MALTLAQMHALLADNTSGDISALDMRDIVTALDARAGMTINLVGSTANFSGYNNAPTADAFWTANSRNVTAADLTDMRQARLVVGVNTASASPNTPTVRLVYRTTYSTAVGDYVSAAASGNIEQSLASQGVFVTAWAGLAAGAKVDVFIAGISTGGNASASPSIYCMAQFR